MVAATDYMRAFADQIRPWVARRYLVLGTDGFGRSDTREKLRRFFEVDRHHVVVAALKALADDGAVPAGRAAEAIARYGIDPATPDPWTDRSHGPPSRSGSPTSATSRTSAWSTCW